MHQTVSRSAFVDAFKRSNERKDSFTYDGLYALYDHLMEQEEEIGEDRELDIAEIDSTYTEYSSIEEFKKDYTHIDWVNELDEEDERGSFQTIRKNTNVFLGYPQGFIIESNSF